MTGPEGSSGVRLLVLLALLAVVAGGSYLKVPAAREAVDARLPFVKTTLARFGVPVETEGGAGTVAPGAREPAAVLDEAAAFTALAADPTAWPRTVRLARPVEFPAVVGGKEVGKVLLKAGTEVNLARIKDGSVGLEYQGGGAWVKPADTDVLARAQPPAPKPAAPAP